MTSLAVPKSARRTALDAVRDLWREVRGGRYHVKRGPINWQGHDFAARPLAVAILMDEASLLLPENEMRVTFEVGAAMAGADDPDVDDGLLDELADDAEWVFTKLVLSVNSAGDSTVLRLDHHEVTIAEWHDPTLLAQGLLVRARLFY